MNLKYKTAHLNGPARPGTAIFVTEGDPTLEGRPELASFRRCLGPLASGEGFKGKFLEGCSLYLPSDDAWVSVTGLGKAEELTAGRIIEAGADAASRLSSAGLKEATMALPPLAGFPRPRILELLALGARLGLNRDPGYRSEPVPQPALKALTLQSIGAKEAVDRPQAVLNRAETVALAQLEARRLDDMPPNMLTPSAFVEEAKRAAMKAKLKITVWEAEKIAIEGAGGIRAVGSGSRNPPALVILEYDGRGGAKDPVALVGKGVTFDSGGICLKQAEGMAAMKSDMSGAAAVLAAIAAASELKASRPLVGVIPLAENMPGGGAWRPGDVVGTFSGQTVEVVNTDAEGRMLLADAISIAQKYRPARLVDIATLTGACQVALGPQIGGLFSNDDALASEIAEAGAASGEAFWRLPLHGPYADELKSDIADFRHAGGRAGGAINAALFLEKFVKPPLAWAHLDIAGPARSSKKTPSCPEGATGFGVRTLIRFLVSDRLHHDS
jgi:leucyl aminopeptidase